MNPENNGDTIDELLEEYAKQYHEGVKLIMLEPDVAEIFPDAKSVNEALRALSKIILQHQKAA